MVLMVEIMGGICGPYIDILLREHVPWSTSMDTLRLSRVLPLQRCSDLSGSS